MRRDQNFVRSIETQQLTNPGFASAEQPKASQNYRGQFVLERPLDGSTEPEFLKYDVDICARKARAPRPRQNAEPKVLEESRF